MTELFRSKFVLNFLIAGIIVFCVYFFSNGLPLAFLLIGPCMFITQILSRYGSTALSVIPWENEFAVLLPITLLYFLLIGIQLHLLSREQGIIKYVGIFSLIGFLVFIHYNAWSNLSAYYIPYH